MIPKLKELLEKYSKFQVLRHRSTSTDVPVKDSHSLSPTVRNAKGQAKMIHELESNIKPKGHEPEPTPETHQPNRSPSLPANTNNKQNSMMLDEFKAQDNSDSDPEPVVIRYRTPHLKAQRRSRTSLQTNESPEHESDSEPVMTRHITTRAKAQGGQSSSHRKSLMLREIEDYNESPERDMDPKQKKRQRKRLLSKPKSSSRRSAPRSQLLREIADYNKSPEPEDRHDLAKARDLVSEFRDTPLTRGARQNLMHDAKDGSLKSRKSLNLKTLMRAEFKGEGKGTKRFQVESSSDLSRHKRQRKDTMGLFVGEEEDDGEET